MNFSLKVEEKLNQAFILSKLSQEQIFAYYLGSNFNKKIFCSPLRSDKRPTVSIYKNKNGNLIYKDFATGQSLNVFEFIKQKFGCNYFQALKIIANDFGLVKDDTIKKNEGKIISKDYKIKDKEFSKIQVEIQDFTESELKWWAKYGITSDILKKYKVYSCKHVFLNGQLVAKSNPNCPIFGYYGGKIKENKEKRELWKIYFPKRREKRFINNYPTKKIQGYEYLPKSGKVLVITKSLKDSMLFNSFNIPSCSPNSETQFINDNMLESLKQRFKYIIVLYDNDETGIKFMNKIKHEHPELIYTWIPRKYDCKDISDFYKKFKRKETEKLIKEFLIWLKDRKNQIYQQK